jgi:hypothetical protein
MEIRGNMCGESRCVASLRRVASFGWIHGIEGRLDGRTPREQFGQLRLYSLASCFVLFADTLCGLCRAGGFPSPCGDL